MVAFLVTQIFFFKCSEFLHGLIDQTVWVSCDGQRNKQASSSVLTNLNIFLTVADF